MGLNPTILRQAQAFAYLFQPTDPPPRTHRSYRSSGLVLTSTPVVRFAQMAVIHRVIEIWARSMLNRIRHITGHVLE